MISEQQRNSYSEPNDGKSDDKSQPAQQNWVDFYIQTDEYKMLISGGYCNKFGNYTPPFIDFLKSCLIIDPTKRPSCIQLLDSPIFAKI